MNPFDGVKPNRVSINGDTAIVEINLNLYPQLSTKKLIDGGMAMYVQKHSPNITSWEARSNGQTLYLYVTGHLDLAAVLRMM